MTHRPLVLAGFVLLAALLAPAGTAEAMYVDVSCSGSSDCDAYLLAKSCAQGDCWVLVCLGYHWPYHMLCI